MSSDSFKVLCQEIGAQLLELLNHVNCSICQELFHKPVKTPCGHSFCDQCIKKVLSSRGNNGCPLCKCIIKKYCLDDKAKFTISEICRELPSAFKNDVKDGCRFLKYSERDILNGSNIIQLVFEAIPKEIINKKRKTFFVDFCKENNLENIELDQCDAKNNFPKLKKNLNSKRHVIAKKKELDDIASISSSGATPVPDVNIYLTTEYQSRPQDLKGNHTIEKVQELLNATENNICPENFLPLPLNISETNSNEDFNNKSLRNADEKTKEIKIENSVSIFRGNQKKLENPLIFDVDFKNNKKKMPDSNKTMRSPTYDLIEKPIFVQEDSDLQQTHNLIKKRMKMKKSALKHGKKNDNKTKRCYANSDFSLELSTIFKKERNELKKKKFKKKDLKSQMNAGQKESFLNLVYLKNEEALQLEQSVEKYLMSFKKDNTLNLKAINKNFKEKNTALLSILEEIVKDDNIYRYCAKNSVIKFSKKILQEIDKKRIKEKNYTLNKDLCIVQSNFYENSRTFIEPCSANEFVNFHSKEDQLIQESDLVGFTLKKQKITEGTKFLGKIIENMEIEVAGSSNFNSKNGNLSQNKKKFEKMESHKCNKKPEFDATKEVDFKTLGLDKINRVNGGKKNCSLILGGLENKIERTKVSFISFLLLGRLTPTTRRSKSSVVKLVFPVGFTSFIRKNAVSNKFATAVQTSQTSFQPIKNFIPRSPNSNLSFQKESYKSQIYAEIQTSTNNHSEIFHSSQVKNYFFEQNLQDMNQRENTDKGPKQFLNTANLEENKSVCRKRSQVQISEQNKLRENDSEYESKNLQADLENLTSPNEELKIFFKSMSDSLDLGNEISNVLDEKLMTGEVKWQNKKQKLSTPSSKNKPSEFSLIELFKGDTKCDQFSSISFQKNQKNGMETKSKKMKESSKNYDDFSSQSNTRVSNSGKESWDTRSPKKFQLAQRACKYYKSNKSDTDLTIRNDEKVFTSSHNKKDFIIEMKEKKDIKTGSQEDISGVLKNIDLDRMIFLPHNETKAELEGEKNIDEKSEESDSDFFVEQTPPSLMYSRLEEAKYLSISECGKSLFSQKPKKRKLEVIQGEHNLNSDNSLDDLLGGNKIGGKNTSPIKYIEGGIKMLGPYKTFAIYGNLEANVQGENGKLSTKKFQHFSPEKLFSNFLGGADFIHSKTNEENENCQRDKGGKDFDDKLIESKSCKTTENFLNEKKVSFVASSVKNLEIIKKFALKFKFDFLDKPSKSMTHLIVGLHENEDGELLPLCTPKLLYAMANKKWVVSELWVETCLKLNKIVPEENFETYDPLGGLGCRTARLSQDFLLENCEIYLLGNFETISKDELADLIVDCGGTLISQLENFSYCSLKIRMILVDKDCMSTDEKYLRGLYEKHRSVVLSRDILIMSIQTYTLSNFFPYLMHVSSTDDLVKLGYPFSLVKQEESNLDSVIS